QVSKNRVSVLDKKIPIYASVFGFIVLVVLWVLFTYFNFVSPLFLPAPSAIVLSGWVMIMNGEIYLNLSASLYRIVIGYAIGASIGIIIRLLLGFSKWFDAIGTPIIY